MALSKEDKDLFEASRKGLSKFELVYKGYYPNASFIDIKNSYDLYKSYSSLSDLDKSSANKSTKPSEGFFDFQSLRSTARFPSIEESGIKLDELGNELLKLGSLFTKPGELGREAISNLFNFAKKNYTTFLQEQSALRTAINKDAGLAFEFADNYREVLSETSPILQQYGISFQNLSDAATGLIVDTGKFYTLNEKTWLKAGQVGEAYTGSMNELVSMLPNLEKVGIGATDAIEAIARAGKESLSLGLRAQNVTKELNANIGKLNEYGFKNGIDGLTRMIQKSTEFRMSMESVFTIADKVMNPEGAIELTANLQALGGAIGDLGDPMKMMYMAVNDVEGLQDALIGATGSLAKFDERSKSFKIMGADLRIAKEMAAQLGINYSEFAKGAVASAERAAAAGDLMRAGLTLDEKQTEFITNIAKMKEGKMVIDVSGSKELMNRFKSESIALEELTQNDADLITLYQKQLEKKTEEDIIRNQATSVTNIERYVASLVAMSRKRFGDISKDALEATISKTAEMFTGIKYDKTANQSIEDFVSVGLDKIKGGTTTIKEYDSKKIIELLGNSLKEVTDFVVDAKNKLTSDKSNTAGALSQTTTPTPTTQNETNTTTGIKSAYDMFVKGITDMKDSFMSYVTGMSDNTKILNSVMNSLENTLKLLYDKLTNFVLPTSTSMVIPKQTENNQFGTFASMNSSKQDDMLMSLKLIYEHLSKVGLTIPTERPIKENEKTVNVYYPETNQDANIQFASIVSAFNDFKSITESFSNNLKTNNTVKTEENKSEMVITHKHTHEHIVKSDVTMDMLSRIIRRYPDLFKNPEEDRSYTSMVTNNVS